MQPELIIKPPILCPAEKAVFLCQRAHHGVPLESVLGCWCRWIRVRSCRVCPPLLNNQGLVLWSQRAVTSSPSVVWFLNSSPLLLRRRRTRFSSVSHLLKGCFATPADGDCQQCQAHHSHPAESLPCSLLAQRCWASQQHCTVTPAALHCHPSRVPAAACACPPSCSPSFPAAAAASPALGQHVVCCQPALTSCHWVSWP